MNFKLSVLLVVAASGCVETPPPTRLPSSRDVSLDAVQLKDQSARYAVDLDSLIPCPFDGNRSRVGEWAGLFKPL